MLINFRILIAGVVFIESLLVTSMPYPAEKTPTNGGFGGRRTLKSGKQKPRLPPISTNNFPITRRPTAHDAEGHSPSRHYQPVPYQRPSPGDEVGSPWDETSPLYGSYDSEFEKDKASMLEYIQKYRDGEDRSATDNVAKYIFPCKS